MNANFIAGHWVEGAAARKDINPSDTQDVRRIAHADVEQVRTTAYRPRVKRKWLGAQRHPRRAATPEFIGNEPTAAQAGTRHASRSRGRQDLPGGIGEVARGGHTLNSSPPRRYGHPARSYPPSGRKSRVEITREPVGVVGLITPWNFRSPYRPGRSPKPGTPTAWCSPATGAGIGVGLDRDHQPPGIPPGVFNLVMGPGRVVGAAIIESEEIAAISFTGSVETGSRAVLARARRASAAGGGKNPLIVLNDADLDVAVNCAVQARILHWVSAARPPPLHRRKRDPMTAS
jgi:aldehyde dehydrogenase (NAD+)